MANIELDGGNKKITVDSGDLTLDIPGDIILDADGADVVFADGGTNILKITNSSSDVVFQPQVDAKDIIFKQYDGTTVATVEDNGTFNIPASKLAIGGTAVTATAAELNLIDGGTARGTTAIADGDGVLINDGGTMRMTSVETLKTYTNNATLIDSWRLSTNATNDVDPFSANLERNDTAGFSHLVGMSVSSGVWTFPSTGFYWVQASVAYDEQNSTGADPGFRTEIQVTTDNSSYNTHGIGYAHLSGTNYQDQGIATSIIDVTDTANVKVKFRTVGLTDGNRIIGNSTEDLTSFKFIRLGDT